MSFLGAGLDEVMVVGGDSLEVGGGHPVRLAFLLEEADDAGGVLEDLDDAVEEDAIDAPREVLRVAGSRVSALNNASGVS